MAHSPSKTSSGQHRSKQTRSYTPLSDALGQPFTFVDTELSEGIARHGLVGLLTAAQGRQRRSDAKPLNQVVCALLAWPLLKAKSLHSFCSAVDTMTVAPSPV